MMVNEIMEKLKEQLDKSMTGIRLKKEEAELLIKNYSGIGCKPTDSKQEEDEDTQTNPLDLFHGLEVEQVEKRLSDCQDRLQNAETQRDLLLDHFLNRDKVQTNSINNFIGVLTKLNQQKEIEPEYEEEQDYKYEHEPEQRGV